MKKLPFSHRSVLTESQTTVKLGVTDLSFHRATAAVIAVVLRRMGFAVERF